MAIVRFRDGKVEYLARMEEGSFGITYCRYCNGDAKVNHLGDNLFSVGCDCDPISFWVTTHGLSHAGNLWNELNYKEHGKSKYKTWEYKKKYVEDWYNGR